VYVLDRRLQPTPIGVPGELYVGGAGVALGYLNRPELTAQRFIHDPFADAESGAARLYRTGDLARYLPNGDLEYLGRCDDQVKIRGFRIELGEIEALLAEHPAVREVAVLALPTSALGGERDHRLVAYLATRPEHTPTIGELRAFLQARLPDYMVPATFVQLPALPLTPNGKLDRRALPEPDSSRPELGTTFVAPRTPLEATLAAIYSQVLGIEQIGVCDNFFALGGDSIRSVRMIAQARQQGIELSLPLIFQNQTIAELAERLAQSSAPLSSPSRMQPFALVKASDRERLPDGLDDAYPLTQLQAGMLFHSEFSPDTTVYHNVTSFQIHGRFDAAALEASVRRLVARHPVLRSSFDMHSFSEPLQLVHSSVTVPVTIADLRELPAEQQARALDQWFEAEQQRKFAWTRPPLLRFQAHRLSDAAFMLSWTEHHAIVDGWSVASMITELLKEYFGLLGQPVEPIHAPEVAFRDYVALELEALESEQQRQFWAEKLRGQTLTPLPRWSWAATESGRRQIRLHEMLLTPELSADLKRLAQAIGVPLKHVLLAAHLRVLAALTGQMDVTSGLVTNGRLEETDGDRVLGLFLNTLPLRVQMNGGSWIDLIRQSFAAEQELSPFRRYPLSALQQANGGQPLFEAVFNFVHFHVYEAIRDLPNVKLLKRKFIQETNFDFIANFRLLLDRDQLQVDIEYDPGSFSDEQIAAIQGYYLRALRTIAGEPQGSYQTFALLAEEDRPQMLAWNVREAAYPQDRCVHELFAEQAARTPDATALIVGDARLSYAELDRRANQLAHHLQALGVGPDRGVGLCMERSLDLVVGLLAILKAGGAYVPLDPAYPQERLQFMLQDAQVPVLLTQAHLADGLAAQAATVRIDADWPQIARQPTTAPGSGVRPEHLAYLIYTSGTTGRPKAVQVEHRNLLNVCWASREVFAFGSQDVVPCIASFAFDIFLFELLNPLLSGGTSLMLSRQQVLETDRLVAELQRATAVHAVPSLMRQIVSFVNEQRIDPRSFSKLRALFVGGDAVPVDLLDAMRQSFPAAQIHVLYGPTEGTIICSSHSVPPSQPLKGQLIGKPLPNCVLRLYGREQTLVPVGVLGELYIGGAGVARGYRNQPELTAQKFVEIDGQRWYRSGDLACYWPDGTIEFLGRIDQQVKLRGFRVELDEIAAVLRQHAAVRDAVVLLRQDETGDARLVAYVVAEQRDAETSEQSENRASELRGFLQERLPDYMIPAAFVTLPALPLTPNGKLDRKALPLPDLTRPDLAQAYVAPRTPTEEILAGMWSQLLKLDRVGIHDNFFELGGHSLLSTQLISRVRDRFQVETPLRVLFDAPTIAALAEAIDSDQSDQQPADRIVAVPRSKGDLDWLLSESDEPEAERRSGDQANITS
jgi:amino acid adenylation domain-containing protein